MWLPNIKQKKVYIVDATGIPLRAVCATEKEGKIFIYDYKESKSDILHDENSLPYALANFLPSLKIKNNSKIIFLWSGTNAATFTATVALKKQNSEKPLARADVDRIFTAATSQFFTQFREESKKRFKVDDIGLILASSRILDFKLDGETQINIGNIKAKRADVSIEQTFIRRRLHEAVTEDVNSTCSILHVEIGSALNTMSRVSGIQTDNSLIAYMGWGKTHLYSTFAATGRSVKLSPVLQYCGEISRGAENTFNEFCNKLGIQKEDADKFMTHLAMNETSAKLTNIVKKNIIESFSGVVTECKSKLQKPANLILFTQEPLAHFAVKNDFSKHIGCHVFSSLMNKDIAQQDVKLMPKISQKALSPVFFAGLVAYWSRLDDNYIGSKAMKNTGSVNWLISHNSI